jgi:hypothetical protein
LISKPALTVSATQLLVQADSVVEAIAAALDLIFVFIVLYELFNFLWNRVLLYIRYVEDHSINIKHSKCYDYSKPFK